MRRASLPWGMIVFAVLVGFNLRAPLAGVQTLTEDIARSLGVGGAGQGLLTGQIVLFLGIGAALAHALTRRLGLERAITVALAMIAIGGFGRLVPGLPAFLAASTFIGTGMGLGSVLVPALIVKHVHRRRGLVMGLYSTAMGAGLAIGAALSVPLAHALGGWPPSLAIWGAVAAVSAGASVRRWSAAVDAGDVAADDAVPDMRTWRSRIAWLVAGFSAATMIVGFAITGWLTAYYAGLGQTAGQAAAYLVWLQTASLAAMLLAPMISDLVAGRKTLLLAPVVALMAGMIALSFAPLALGLPASILVGLGIGASSGMTLVLAAEHTRTHHEASRMTGMVMLVSYPLSAIAPVAVGLVRDLTGSLTAGLLSSTVFAAAYLLVIPVSRTFAPGDARRRPAREILE